MEREGSVGAESFEMMLKAVCSAIINLLVKAFSLFIWAKYSGH